MVVAGAIGKVNSEAKFIDTGIIGTKKVPSNSKFIPTSQTLPLGNVKHNITAHKTTAPQIIRNGIKNFYFFWSTMAQTILEATPKTAVTPP